MTDLPKGLQALPSNLEAETVARLFFQLSVEEKNEAVWLELLSADWFDIFKDRNGNVTKKNPRGKATSCWRMLTDGRTFTFEKADAITEKNAKFFFCYLKDGVSKPNLPVALVKEQGQWKVDNARLF